ncbi:hypothetical protein DYB30_008623 [Aphanomyces astaci]|uniref:HTH CENPB-type domain-containing protein n=1 Tax=Aphanomyces astaci TaxID=112090 RepID=A0A397E4N5_APHAT|nr:hypothetical protein DYB30_008623 [Aphanomyces astaci]
MRGTEVAHAANIPYEVVMRRVRVIKAGKEVVVQRRGPKPTLAKSCEEDLVAWISGMQSRGYPTSRYAILVKANQILRHLDPLGSLTGGWYQRFLQRHPQLTNRVAQVMSSARNSIDEAGVALLLDSMSEAMKEHNFTADRIFNMDETSFTSRRKSKDVVALKGSRNVWAKTVPTNFHLSIVACGSADGMILPPLFLFPGESVNKDLGTYCSQQDALRRQLLALPAEQAKRVGPKRITVAGRILTLALTQEIDKTKEERAKAAKETKALKAKRAKRKAKRRTCDDNNVAATEEDNEGPPDNEGTRVAKATKPVRAKRAKRKAKRRTCDVDDVDGAVTAQDDDEGPPSKVSLRTPSSISNHGWRYITLAKLADVCSLIHDASEERMLRLAMERSAKEVGYEEVAPVAPARVFYPTMEEFANPVAYINHVAKEGARYGIAKIVPPKGWAPPHMINYDNDTHKFETKLQKVHRLQEGKSYKDGKDHTLQSYRKAARAFKAAWFARKDIDPATWTDRDFEKEYWKIVETSYESLEVLR